MAKAENTYTPASPKGLAALVASYYAAFEGAESEPEDSRAQLASLRKWKHLHARILSHEPASLAEFCLKAEAVAHYETPGAGGIHTSCEPTAVLWRNACALVAEAGQ